MCVPLPLIGLALSVASGFATAAMQGQQAKQAAIIEQEQLKTEMENEKIKGMSDTNDRIEEFRKAEAVNRAALSNTGVDNASYLYGILPENRRTVGRDVRNIEFNLGQVIGRKKYEISVAGYKAKAAKRGAFIEAGAGALGKIGEFAMSSGGGMGGGTANSITAQ